MNSFVAFFLCVILDFAVEAVLSIAVKVVPWLTSGLSSSGSIVLAPVDPVPLLAPSVLEGCDLILLVLVKVALLINSCNGLANLTACVSMNSGGSLINVIEGYFCWILLGNHMLDFAWKGCPEELHFEERKVLFTELFLHLVAMASK